MWGLFHKLVINLLKLPIVSSWEQSIKRNMREILDPSHPLKFRDINPSSDFFFFSWVLSNAEKMLNLTLVPRCAYVMAEAWDSHFFYPQKNVLYKKSCWVLWKGNWKLPGLEGPLASGCLGWQQGGSSTGSCSQGQRADGEGAAVRAKHDREKSLGMTRLLENVIFCANTSSEHISRLGGSQFSGWQRLCLLVAFCLVLFRKYLHHLKGSAVPHAALLHFVPLPQPNLLCVITASNGWYFFLSFLRTWWRPRDKSEPPCA